MAIFTDVNADYLKRMELATTTPVATWHGHQIVTIDSNNQHCCYFIPPHIHDHFKQHCAECLPDYDMELYESHASQAALFRQERHEHAHEIVRDGDDNDVERHIFRRPALNGDSIQKIYNANHKTKLPGTLIDVTTANDATATRAFDAAKKTYNFYLEVFNRNSIDGKGMEVISTVHYAKKYDNAFWNGKQMVYGDGDQVAFADFTVDLDVPAHEITHGVTEHTLGLEYANQSGAINEHISDAFGSMIKQYSLKETVDQANWLIGDGVLIGAGALRSMKAPGTAYDTDLLGKDPQPATMSGYVQLPNDSDNDWGGVHINSGILNHAFYLACIALGGNSWEKAGKIWYRTLQDRSLKPTATFVDFANSTIASAKSLATANADWTGNEFQTVINAWKQVEVL